MGIEKSHFSPLGKIAQIHPKLLFSTKMVSKWLKRRFSLGMVKKRTRNRFYPKWLIYWQTNISRSMSKWRHNHIKNLASDSKNKIDNKTSDLEIAHRKNLSSKQKSKKPSIPNDNQNDSYFTTKMTVLWPKWRLYRCWWQM